MNDDNFDRIDLNTLEERVDELVKTISQLKFENEALRNHQENLMNEKAALIEKTEKAKARIEAIITRLHGMENGSER